MRILFYDTSTVWSGRTRAFHDAAHALVGRGYEITIGCLPGSPLEVRARATGIPVAHVPLHDGLLVRMRSLRDTIREHYVDVVFVHDEQAHIAAALASRSAGRASVVRRVEAGGVPVVRWRTRIASRLAAVTWLLTSSEDWASGGVPPGEAYVRGELGVTIPAERHPGGNDERPRVTCIGQAAARDRVAQVLRAVSLLADRHGDLELSMTGSAARLDALRVQAAALGLAGSVHWSAHDHEGDALGGARLACVVADADEAAFGCLDAMARGVPVLAPRTPVTARLVRPGMDGELLATLDAPSLAAAAADYLVDAERSRRAGRAARERVTQHYSDRDLANAFEHASRTARESERLRGQARS